MEKIFYLIALAFMLCLVLAYRYYDIDRFSIYLSVGDPVKYYVDNHAMYGKITAWGESYCTVVFEENETLVCRTEDLRPVKHYNYQNHEWE